MHSLIVLSCDWDVFRLAMACKFFGGLTDKSQLATAYYWIGCCWQETAAAYRSIPGDIFGYSR